MNREETARNKYRNGNNCAVSVYSAFYDKISGMAPMPRSEGGKCGAVLSAEKVLSQLGYSMFWSPLFVTFVTNFLCRISCLIRGTISIVRMRAYMVVCHICKRFYGFI